MLKPGGRFFCLEFSPRRAAAAAAALRSLFLHGPAAARPGRRRRPRRLSAIWSRASAAFRRRASWPDDGAAGPRAGRVPQPHRRHRGAPFRLAALTGSDRCSAVLRSRPQPRPARRIACILARHDALFPLERDRRRCAVRGAHAAYRAPARRRADAAAPGAAARRGASSDWGRASSSSGSCCRPAPISSAKRSPTDLASLQDRLPPFPGERGAGA